MKLIGLIVINLLVSKLIMSQDSRLCTRNIFLRRYSNSKLDNNTAWSFRTCSYSVCAITQYLRKTPNCFKLTQILWCCLFNSKFCHLANNGRRKKALPFPLTTDQSVCIVQQLFFLFCISNLYSPPEQIATWIARVFVACQKGVIFTLFPRAFCPPPPLPPKSANRSENLQLPRVTER